MDWKETFAAAQKARIVPCTTISCSERVLIPMGAKRYDTLQEVRKAALAKSNRLFSQWDFGIRTPISVYVFKGDKYLGCVETSKMLKFRAFDGMWMSKENPKDPSPLMKDGTIGAKRRKRNHGQEF